MGGIGSPVGSGMRLIAAALSVAVAGCNGDKLALDGDPERGRLLLRQFGCGTCHRISGVADAQGNVGPPLDGVRSRVYLGGVLPNSPDRMARWIRTPKAFDPQTAMPNLGVSEEHARDMVAYLYKLR
jgi:cytochrome c